MDIFSIFLIGNAPTHQLQHNALESNISIHEAECSQWGVKSAEYYILLALEMVGVSVAGPLTDQTFMAYSITMTNVVVIKYCTGVGGTNRIVLVNPDE